MKKVLVIFAVLFAFANVSADLDFSDSKVWKKYVTSQTSSVFVEKYKSNLYINAWICDLEGYSSGWISKGSNIKGLAFGENGATWVATDSGLVRQSPVDTVKYYVEDGLSSNKIRAVYYDRANGRIIIGTDQGVGISKVDAKGRPTTWTNALSVSIHKFAVAKNADVWAINNTKVYRFVNGVWDNGDDQSWHPQGGDVDVNGNFWVSFARTISGTTSEVGLAKFDGQTQTWKEYFVSTSDASLFGKISIDRDNTLWFSCGDAGIGRVNLSTMAVERIPAGTYPWAPRGLQAAISKDENGLVIFSGVRGGVYAIAPSPVLPRPIVRNLYRGSEKVIGIFDLKGRKIVNNSFSSAPSSGMRFVAVRTSRGIEYQKSISAR